MLHHKIIYVFISFIFKGHLSKYLIEERAITSSAKNLNDLEVSKALKLLDNCYENNLKLIVSGVGKSGIVARKIAATFSSVGLTSIFLNPLDALHGDIGIVNKNDLCLLLSNSGETTELMEMIPHLKSRETKCIALTGNIDSYLAKHCDVFLSTKVEKEICPLNLAPTASTTVSMAIGDALASAWMDRNNISTEEFAFNHPGGSLGRKLTITVKDVMLKRDEFSSLNEESSVIDIISQITLNAIGCCWIEDSEKRFSFLGIITDGDLRRSLEKTDAKSWGKLKAKDLMTTNPITIGPKVMAIEALNLMEKNYKKPVNVIPVISEKKEFLGFLRLHDLIQRGL